MNADIHPTNTCHPLRVDGDAIHALGLGLKENAPRQTGQMPDWRNVMSERYPLGLFSEAEVQALCELIAG